LATGQRHWCKINFYSWLGKNKHTLVKRPFVLRLVKPCRVNLILFSSHILVNKIIKMQEFARSKMKIWFRIKGGWSVEPVLKKRCTGWLICKKHVYEDTKRARR